MFIRIKMGMIRHIYNKYMIIMMFICSLITAATNAASPDIAAIDAFIELQMSLKKIHGLALAITHKDKIFHIRGFGFAEKDRKVTPQTPFYIGSLSKSFTSLAIMQLSEAGKIDIDAPVKKYLTWFEAGDPDKSDLITVRHLLNQTSGLSKKITEDLPINATMEDAVRALRYSKPSDPPGTKFHYFNLNFVVLGVLVEKVSGISYTEYVQKHILEPLEMKNTFFSEESAKKAGLAQGHNVFFGFQEAGEQPFIPYLIPAGFIISTAEDLSHYMICQNNKGYYKNIRILSESGISEIHRPVINSYAMGWYSLMRLNRRVIHHPGNNAFFHTEALMLPEEGYSVIMLINQNNDLDSKAYKPIADGILSLLIGADMQK